MNRTYRNVWSEPLGAWVPVQKLMLGTEGLFRFDGWEPGELSSGGRLKIEALAAEIKRNPRPLRYVVVTGRTDRLGSDALFLVRAGTVRDLLSQRGIATKVVDTGVPGEQRGGRSAPESTRALLPNRSVELEVVEET